MEDITLNSLDIASSIYMVVGSVIVSGLAWGGKKLIDLINIKVKNELLRGILGRLAGSIVDAVAMVNQTLKKQIKAAKAPASPGGDKFTDFEKKQMFDAVWSTLKAEYGGWKGIFSLLKKIGFGEASAKVKIDTMIESSVNAQKNAGGSGPE